MELKKYADSKRDKSFGTTWVWWLSLMFSLFLKYLGDAENLEKYDNEMQILIVILFAISIVNYFNYCISIINREYLLYPNFKKIYDEIYITKIEDDKFLKIINKVKGIFIR